MTARIPVLNTQQIVYNGVVQPLAQVRFFKNKSTDPITVYSDAGLTTPLAQPLVANAVGVVPVAYTSEQLVRVTIHDQNVTHLSTMDDVGTISAGELSADGISFRPYNPLVPATNVQDAIETVADTLANSDQLNTRGITPYKTGGSGTAYNLNPEPAITQYAGQTFTVRVHETNTGPATLDVSGLGPRPWRTLTDSGAIREFDIGELRSGRDYMVNDSGDEFITSIGLRGDYSGGSGAEQWYVSGGLLFQSAAVTFDYSTQDYLRYEWTFPRQFSAEPFLIQLEYPWFASNYIGFSRSNILYWISNPVDPSTAVREFQIRRNTDDFVPGVSLRGVNITAVGPA